jgi:hypothetical protein
MQAFVLPKTAADVVVFRTPDRRADWLVVELVVLVVALLGAVPAGGRSEEEQRPRRSGGLGAGMAGDVDAVDPADVDPADVDPADVEHARVDAAGAPFDPDRFSPPEPARA